MTTATDRPALLRPLSDDELSSDARPLVEQVQRAVGKAPNLHRALAHSPAALRYYLEGAGALAGGRLDARLREQIALASAGANGCAYCASAHNPHGPRRRHRRAGARPQPVGAIRRAAGRARAGLRPRP